MRLIKFTAIVFGAIVGLFVVLVAFNYYFPPTYEAVTRLPGTSSEIVVQLEPMHPYLAEYRRSLVLRKVGASDQRAVMFPDTGGYSRTQLYRLADGRFLVRGYFDAVIIDPEKHTLVVAPTGMRGQGTYIGAFDDTTDRRWQFIEEVRSPELPLEARGG